VKRAEERKASAYGRATTNLVSSAPTLAKIAELRAAGWTWVEIADAAGMPLKQPKDLYGTKPKRVRPHTEAAILAIKERPPKRPKAFVDATGTRRRLQALITMGHPMPMLAQRLGWLPSNLWSLACEDVGCTERTRQTVAALYDELWSKPAPDGLGKTRAIQAATRAGWHGPLAWDDDTIDDPKARPIGARRSEKAA
jgi:hypothetical protein